jgi:hypothetical protein
MSIALALTLLFAAPSTPDPFAGLPSGPAAMFNDYLVTRGKQNRKLEVVAKGENGGTTRAVLLDRTGCLRGWVILTATAPKTPGHASEFEAVERLTNDCEKPTSLAHFARIHDAIAREDKVALGAYFDVDTKFPVGLEAKTATRKTWTGADVTKGKVKLPTCDLLTAAVTCTDVTEPDASGSIPNTCECESATRKLVYELRTLTDRPGPPTIQVTSIRETSKPAAKAP